MNGDDFIKIGFIEGKGNSAQSTDYKYKDNVEKIGNYYYRIKQIDYDGSFKYSQEIIVNVTAIANENILYQNYPNPFNPITTIEYIIPQSGNVTLNVYDLLGEKVDEVVNEFKESGIYHVEFDASNLSSGTYIYILRSNGNSVSKKMVVLR